MIKTPTVWSLSDPLTADTLLTKSMVLRTVASLAYIDIFLHQVPTPELIWNTRVVDKLSLAHHQILKQAVRLFHEDQLDVLSNLLDFSYTGRISDVMSVFMADGDVDTIQLIRFVLYCRNYFGDFPKTVVGVFLITPDLTPYRYATLNVTLGNEGFPGSPFVKWCAVVFMALMETGTYPFSSLLGRYVSRIRIPVNAMLQPTMDKPYPYTAFILRRQFFQQF